VSSVWTGIRSRALLENGSLSNRSEYLREKQEERSTHMSNTKLEENGYDEEYEEWEEWK
jgi:hypothetical protein